MSTSKTPIERFVEKIDVDSNGCWQWTRGKDRDGYGLFADHRQFRAHIWSYQRYVGGIPAGFQLDHTCRVRSCVNPDHLEPVTCQVNIHRGEGLAAQNAKKTHCKRGHLFDVTNTREFVEPNGSVGRECKTCKVVRRKS